MGVDREARGYAQSQMDGCQWAVKSSRVQTHTASACMDTKILEYGKASTRNPYGARPRYAGVIPVGTENGAAVGYGGRYREHITRLIGSMN